MALWTGIGHSTLAIKMLIIITYILIKIILQSGQLFFEQFHLNLMSKINLYPLQ